MLSLEYVRRGQMIRKKERKMPRTEHGEEEQNKNK